MIAGHSSARRSAAGYASHRVPVRHVNLEKVDPETGAHGLVLGQLTTGIDVLAAGHQRTEYLVLQHSSGPLFSGPGQLIHVDADGVRTTMADCFDRPTTSMVQNEKTGAVYVTEITGGRLVRLD